MIIAIDPGSKQSAFLVWDVAKGIGEFGIFENDKVLEMLPPHLGCGNLLAVEMIASYGMAVGREVFETCLWIGRFVQAFQPGRHELVYRKDVKMHHCHSMRATDANIRMELIDKYGEPGTKKAPGLTYGLKAHLWAAFAIATYITERESQEAKQLQQNPTLGI